jgi:membrane-bound lytic murein transglycosylase D
MNFFCLLLLFSSSLLAAPVYRNPEFPVVGAMRTRVNFWKKVYTEITTKEGFIHDQVDLTVIYKKISKKKKKRDRIRQSRAEKGRLRKLLHSMAKKNSKNLSREESQLQKVVGDRSPKELRRMARDIRVQYGLKDRYYRGLIRSYAYLEYIEKIFKELRIPHELTYLPHVESSFNYHAYSKVGAAGIWQFMRGTARNYGLKVGYIIDERRDPIKATRAAAKLLRDNHAHLKKWPLALTAYNHGPSSVSRAIKKVGSTNINQIIEKYNGRRFGFASKNFYATFMATVEISENPQAYFPKFKKPKAYTFSSVPLERPFTIKQISKQLDLSTKAIKELNPAIRSIVYRSNLYLPKGYDFRVPNVNFEKLSIYKNALRKLKVSAEELALSSTHIINRGETLYDISRIYRVSLRDLIRFNKIQNPSRIYAGLRVKIPSKADKKTLVNSIVNERKKVIKVPAIKAPEPKLPVILNSDLKKRLEIIQLDPKVSLESYELRLKGLGKNIFVLTIETEETLGHYADWAGISTQRIRDLNRFRFGTSINFGDNLKIRLSAKQKEKLQLKRSEYHLSIQEDFYEAYDLGSTKKYTIKRGDNLSEILKELKLKQKSLLKFLRIKKKTKAYSCNHKTGHTTP